MCYNIIKYHEFRCGHYSIIKRQTVDCNSKRCRLSGRHETERHDCESTCAKEMLPDQGIVTDAALDIKCSRCAGGMNGR